jgi:hypothetical protein
VQFPLVENLNCPILDRKICNSLKRGKVLNYVQECHENYAGVSVAQNQTIERGYLQIYRLLFDCRSGLACRAGQCGFYQHDQDSSYVDLGFFLPDAPGVDVISTSQSLRTKDMAWLEAVEAADMELVETAELFCADFEAPEREARSGGGGNP